MKAKREVKQMPENKKVALKIEGLNKTLGKRHILHDIAFEA